MKRIKVSICIVVILIIILLIALLFNNNINKNSSNIFNNNYNAKSNTNNNIIYDNIENNITYNEEEERKYKEENAIGKVRYENDITKYFTIISITEKYTSYLGEKEDEIIKDIVIDGYDNKLDSVPEISSYKQSINILLPNIIKARVDENKYIYIVDTNYRLSSDVDTHDIKIMIGIDYNNRTYKVFPLQYIIDQGLNNIKIGDNITYNLSDITKNDNNSLVSTTKNDLEVANILFADLKERFRYYSDKVYEKLDSEYAKQRFKYQNSFTEYLQDNKTYFSMMTIDEYKVNTTDEYKEYICSDKYGNIYSFRLSLDDMTYTAFLDNYTIKSEEDTESYNKLGLRDKATYNARIFIDMINNKDYYHIYDLLDDTFRNNNFKSVDDLKLYLKSNLYDQNGISVIDTKEETDCFVVECNILNKRSNTASKQMVIIVKQEDNNYKLSFNIQN